MKWGLLVMIVVGMVFSAGLTKADESAVLIECKAVIDRLNKDIKDIKNNLTPLEEKIKKREEKIVRYQRFDHKYGKPVDRVRKEIKDLKKKLGHQIRREGGYVGTGRHTSMDRFGHSLMGGSERIKALQEELKKREDNEKDLIRKAEKAMETELPKDTLLDLDDFHTELNALIEGQRGDNATRNFLNRRLASKKADLARKQKTCQALKENISSVVPGEVPSASGVVTFIGGIQIPTPKSGMDLPIEDESGPNFEESWGYIPLMQISYNDPRTKAYYDALREDFKAVFGTKKDEQPPSDTTLFSKSGAEYLSLLEDSRNAGWKNTPIRPYQGTYLVFVECAKRIRFRLHVVRSNARSTFGGVYIFGLQPGRHPVRMVIATEDGQRFEANFALIVTFEPEKRKLSNLEVGPDGKIIDTGRTVVVNLAYLKKKFNKMWENHLSGRARAQKNGDKNLMRATLEMGVNLVYSHVEDMKDQPGCKAADIDPLLAKGGGAVTLLFTQFGADVNDHAPWQEMLRFAKLCKGVGTRTAYDVLAAVIRYAENSASRLHQDTLGYSYELLGEIALMQGRFKEALAHLNTGLEHHKQANPDYLTEKGRTDLPSLDQIKYMLDKMTG